MRPVSVYEDEPAFAGLVNLVRSATLAFTNYELNVFDTHEFQPIPQAEYGGIYGRTQYRIWQKKSSEWASPWSRKPTTTPWTVESKG